MRMDLHTHSEYSEDAKPGASVRETCLKAIERGISVLAVTDHTDFYFTKAPILFDVDAQRRDLAACRDEFAGALTLLSGVELGQIHAGADAAAYASCRPFDVVIGSLHVYRKNDIDMYFQKYETMDMKSFLDDYFADLLLMVRQGGFDVLAHIDYPLRVMKLPGNHPSFAGWEDAIEPILREIIDREIAFEINAATLFSWQKKPGPERFVLDMYRRLGGSMLSIGSDSHCAADVGRGIDECTAYARACGFREVTYFKNRKPHAVSI